MRIFNGISEVEEAAGTHLGHSDWHEITQEQINAFADATGDRQWIHVDAERAANGPFGATVAHGFLTLSLLPMLAAEVYTIEGVAMGVNYGCNKVRFPAPVPVGSKVRAGVELVSVEQTAAGHLVTARMTVEIEGAAKPGCVAESLAVVVP
ncbi:MAG: MaoC family dehydratase [Pseudonocardia sp.]|nr:MaoC family dehydratase [Pseudonocardia sp.]